MKNTRKVLLIPFTFCLCFAWPTRYGQNSTQAASAVAQRADSKLTDQEGHPFQFSQLRGKLALIFFGYTTCPDACPTTLSKLSHVYKMLDDSEQKRLVTVFVSVDPGRDTPPVLKKYLAYFRINTIGLTGPKEDIDQVVRQYGAKYEIEQSDSAAGYHINHSTDLYLLNERGEVARTFSYADGAQLIADEVHRLQAQGSDETKRNQ